MEVYGNKSRGKEPNNVVTESESFKFKWKSGYAIKYL